MHSVRDRFLVILLTVAVLSAGRARLQAQQLGKPAGDLPKPSSESKPPKPSKLEEMLAEALRNNPDVRVATANVTKAEAELQRVRLQVVQQVVTLHYAIEKAQAEVAAVQKQMDRAELHKVNRVISSAEYDAIQEKLAAAKLKLESVHAESAALFGKAPKESGLKWHYEWDTGTKLSVDQSISFTEYKSPLPAKPSSRMEKIRKALQTPVKVNYNNATLSDILKDLEKQAPGLKIHTPFRTTDRLTLQFDEPMLAAVALQAIEDELMVLGHPRFVIREYGILLTAQESIPPGTWTPLEYLRRAPKEEPKSGK